MTPEERAAGVLRWLYGTDKPAGVSPLLVDGIASAIRSAEREAGKRAVDQLAESVTRFDFGLWTSGSTVARLMRDWAMRYL